MESSDAPALVSDRVFRRLCADVLSGRYAPGEKLPTQRRLAADLGVNMASVREAVKRLEQLRLVEVRQGDAMRVRDWRLHGGLDVIAHALASAGELDRDTLASVMEARRLMLAEVARLAAGRRTAEQAAALCELAERMAGAPGGPAAQALDLAFFSEAIDASGNLVFVLIMNTIRQLSSAHAALFQAVVADHGELVPLYREAAAAIAGRRPEAAAAAVRRLAEAQERRVESALWLSPAGAGARRRTRG